MSRLGRFKKFAAAVLAGAVVLVASIPLDADPKLVAAGNIIIALSVLFSPANAVPPLPTRVARPGERPRRFESP